MVTCDTGRWVLCGDGWERRTTTITWARYDTAQEAGEAAYELAAGNPRTRAWVEPLERRAR
jgi:hypothetical protein